MQVRDGPRRCNRVLEGSSNLLAIVVYQRVAFAATMTRRLDNRTRKSEDLPTLGLWTSARGGGHESISPTNMPELSAFA